LGREIIEGHRRPGKGRKQEAAVREVGEAPSQAGTSATEMMWVLDKRQEGKSASTFIFHSEGGKTASSCRSEMKKGKRGSSAYSAVEN